MKTDYFSVGAPGLSSCSRNLQPTKRTFLIFFFLRKKAQQPRLITIKSYTEICIEAGE